MISDFIDNGDMTNISLVDNNYNGHSESRSESIALISPVKPNNSDLVLRSIHEEFGLINIDWYCR